MSVLTFFRDSKSSVWMYAFGFVRLIPHQCSKALNRRKKQGSFELTAEEHNVDCLHFLDLCFKLLDYDIHRSSEVNPVNNVKPGIIRK